MTRLIDELQSVRDEIERHRRADEAQRDAGLQDREFLKAAGFEMIAQGLLVAEMIVRRRIDSLETEDFSETPHPQRYSDSV